MVKVSVIVPVYNASKYLRQCISSLINQSLKDIEIIFVDDNSSDNSLDIIKGYSSTYKNIKYIHNKTNLGPGASRNIGLRMAKGDYVGFVDSDDMIDSSMLKTMYEGALNNDYPDIITSGIRFINDNSEIFKSDYIDTGRMLDNSSIVDNIFFESPSVCNKLFKRDLIKNESFLEQCMWEDFAFNFAMLIKSNSILSFSNLFYLYRKDITTGISSKAYNINAPLEDTFRIADYIEEKTKEYGKYEKYKELINMLQVSVCLERLTEINRWNVDEDTKLDKMIWLYNETRDRYGDWKELDVPILSARCDILLLDKIDNLVKMRRKTL